MTEVEAFLRPLHAAASEIVQWPEGFALDLHTYLTDTLPPRPLLTSARAVVLRDDGVLVVTDRTPSTHVLPGGRIEAHEQPRETVIREVAEESGWEVEPGIQIGVRHFRHLKPPQEGFTLPYPDFFQVVYVARALRFRPETRDDTGWETEALFLSVETARGLKLGSGEQVLLEAALRARRLHIQQPMA